MTVYGEDYRLVTGTVLEARAMGLPTPSPYWTWSDFWLHKIQRLLDALANDGVEVYAESTPVTNSTIFRAVAYRTPVVATSYTYASMRPVQLGYRHETAIAQCAVDLHVFNFPEEQVFNILVMLARKLYYEEKIPKDIQEAMHRDDLEWSKYVKEGMHRG